MELAGTKKGINLASNRPSIPLYADFPNQYIKWHAYLVAMTGH